MMMASDSERDRAGLAIIMGEPSKEESMDDLELALESATEEIMMAFEQKDSELLKQSLRSFVEMVRE